MASFALITEGITDQAVLENILTGLYGEDVEVNPLQPLRDATDTSRVKSDSFAGWLVGSKCLNIASMRTLTKC